MRAEASLPEAGGWLGERLMDRVVRWALLLVAVLVAVAWAALVVLAKGGDRWVWGGATAALVLLGLLAAWQPMWAIYGCLLLRAVSLNYLYGWRDPMDGFYAPVEASQLKAFGQLISMDSMQASFLLVVACIVLFLQSRPLLALKKMVLPFGAFLALMGLSWVLGGGELYGVKTAASVVTPILFGAAVYAVVAPQRDSSAFERLLYYSVAFSVAVGIVAQLLGGKPLLALHGDMLRFCGGTAPPGFCMVVFPALALAYSRALRQDWRAWLLVTGLLFLIGTTLTRAHLWVAMVVLVVGALLAPRRKLRTALVGVLASLVVVWMFWDPLQRRTFGPGKLPGYLVRFFVEEDVLERVGLTAWREVDTSGRRALWRDYWRLARQRPLCGYGPGSAQVLLEKPGWTRQVVPHNEYLRLVIETGVPGALVYFGALFYLLAILWRRRRAQGLGALWVDAAVLCLGILLLLAVSENVLYVQGFPSAVLAVAAVALKSTDAHAP